MIYNTVIYHTTPVRACPTYFCLFVLFCFVLFLTQLATLGCLQCLKVCPCIFYVYAGGSAWNTRI